MVLEVPRRDRKDTPRVLTGLSTLATLVGFYAITVGPRRVVTRRFSLTVSDWSNGLEGLQVAVLADFHAGVAPVGPRRLRRIVRRVSDQRPDLVVLLGDFVDAREVRPGGMTPEDVADALGGLRSRLGVVSVLGNHDWRSDGPRVRGALGRIGVTMLENGAVEVGDGLWVAGVADAGERDADVDAALAGVPAGAPALLLTHHPDVFPRVPARVALTLAGHTHGSQVALPLRGRWTPSRFGARYGGGHVEEGGRQMVVSRGLGTSRYPARLFAPPEILVLTLRSR